MTCLSIKLFILMVGWSVLGSLLFNTRGSCIQLWKIIVLDHSFGILEVIVNLKEFLIFCFVVTLGTRP